MGGSLFRIHRDSRFSLDKTPFKTHVAMRFPHDGRSAERPPSFYLRLAPGDCVGGGGLYHTDMPALRKIRARIHEDPAAWRAVLATGLAIEGEQLKRVPAGYGADHAFADDLKRRDYYAIDAFTIEDVGSADFAERYADQCRRIAPLVRFLTEALDLKW